MEKEAWLYLKRKKDEKMNIAFFFFSIYLLFEVMLGAPDADYIMVNFSAV